MPRVKTSFTERLKDPPRQGGARHTMMQQLIDRHCIGVKLKTANASSSPQSETQPSGSADNNIPPPALDYEQNYVAVRYMGDFGPRIFLHGRELFRDEDAFHKLKQKPEGLTYTDLQKIFNDEAIEKIAQMSRPASLDSRLVPMTQPQDPLTMGLALVESFSQQFPGLDFSSVPQPTYDNLEIVRQKLFGILEANKVDVGKEGIDRTLAPTADAKDAIRFQLRDRADNFFEHTIATELAGAPEMQERARALKEKLWPYVEKNGYDPAIYTNFAIGIMHSTPAESNIDTIIERGTLIQAYTLAFGACQEQNIANPFSQRMREAESKSAQALAQMLHPRVLNYAMNNRTAFVTIDAEGNNRLKELLTPVHLNTAAAYERLTPLSDTTFNDSIAVSSPEFDQDRIGILSRHELAHLMDLTAPERFETMYAKKGKGEIERDVAHVQEWKRLINSICEESPETDIRRMLALARKLKLDGSQSDSPDQETVHRIRDELKKFVQWTQFRMEVFKSETASSIDTLYSSKVAQLNEVPAVVEELKATFGREFAREMMPELYPMVMRHQLQHPGLRSLTAKSATTEVFTSR